MIRDRRDEDPRRCVALLRQVHAADRYPVIWPADPGRWLTGRHPLGAWVSCSSSSTARLISMLSARNLAPGRMHLFLVTENVSFVPARAVNGG